MAVKTERERLSIKPSPTRSQRDSVKTGYNERCKRANLPPSEVGVSPPSVLLRLSRLPLTPTCTASLGTLDVSPAFWYIQLVCISRVVQCITTWQIYWYKHFRNKIRRALCRAHFPDNKKESKTQSWVSGGRGQSSPQKPPSYWYIRRALHLPPDRLRAQFNSSTSINTRIHTHGINLWSTGKQSAKIILTSTISTNNKLLLLLLWYLPNESISPEIVGRVPQRTFWGS